MLLKFTKMHGIGNDYIYVNCFEQHIDNPSDLSVKLSHRRFGVGADGLVLILPSKIADFKMRIFNADGSEAMMCGNATRCIGKYVYDRGLINKTTVTLETNSGIKELKLSVANRSVQSVEVNMGKAILNPNDIPLISNLEQFVSQPVDVNGNTYKITAVSMGNPHAVVFMDDIDILDLEKMGPYFENLEIFPNRVNTEFIQVIDPNTLRMRVWERGSGETYACGTGACAAAVAAVLNGFSIHNSQILVHLKGGDLLISYLDDGTVFMSGPAAFVFDGQTII